MGQNSGKSSSTVRGRTCVRVLPPQRGQRNQSASETLVKNLLKITKLDAGTIVPEKNPENVADMLRDSQSRFAYRASEEEKEIFLSGPEEAMLLCDRGWLREAIDNLIKNALDHTKAGDAVCLEWKILPGAVQICVRDNKPHHSGVRDGAAHSGRHGLRLHRVRRPPLQRGSAVGRRRSYV